MSPLELRQKLHAQLDRIPEAQLDTFSTLIQQFHASLNPEKSPPRTPGLLSGKLSNSFFEPLPEEELQSWE
jgi:hypothetical protein